MTATATTKQKGLLNALARALNFSSSKALEPMPQDAVGVGAFGSWDSEPMSLQFLMGQDGQARTRQQIYADWQWEMGDPIASTALQLHVTAALGGHETKGDMVFIEASPKATSAAAKKVVDVLKAELQPLFNLIAPTLCFTAAGFGDGYARIYGSPRVGVRDLLVDELVYPPLIQAYERGNTTIGYTASTGSKFSERLTVAQIARMKMPRMVYVPQQRAVEKALRINLTEDDPEKLEALPALVGGSFLIGTERPYRALNTAMAGLTGMRVLDALDEQMIGVNLESMTQEQQKKFMRSIKSLLQRSHDYAKKAAVEGKPIFGRIRHLLPAFGEKQLFEIKGAAGGGNTGASRSYTIDDVMLYARLFAGAMGTDLSLLGFADQMAGGLGEGGFFRTSAQAAERSRMLRVALIGALEHVIRVHLYLKDGTVFSEADKPWEIKFWSGISALEKEKQETFTNAVNTAALLTQTLTGLRDLGMDEKANILLLKNYAGMDEADAEDIAKALGKAKPPEGMGGLGGPGGMGGPDMPDPGELGEFGKPNDGGGE